jgi:GxxExxY protein
MSSEEGKILFKDLSYTIVGLAIGIHNELGAGFLEKVYENAMAVSLRKEGIAFQQQVKTPIYFQGEVVGDYTADLVVDDKIILELKAVDAIVDIHKAQVLN